MKRNQNNNMEELKEDLTYEKAMEELEAIVERVEDKNAPLDKLEEDIKRGMALIAFCKGQLRGYRERISAIMDDNSEEK